MKKLLSLLAIFVVIFAAGCTEPQPTLEELNEQPPITVDEALETVDPFPEDYVGVWQRTATYVNGELESEDPAIWTLNNTNYTSTGTCINTGKVMNEGGNKITITLDSTTCPNVPTGITVPYTYEIKYDEERDVEVMTVVTGPMTETWDRQS
ncbi:hypothetical protein ACFL3T_02085 [Patescibacteria group bacterium]